MKTYQPKAGEIKRENYELDAEGQVLGRFATKVAELLIGKGKVTFSRHMDVGDFVTVTNADKIIVTGKKAQQKVYQSHSGYPGGFKERKFEKVMSEHPERIIEHAVSGMLPNNRLKSERMKRLNVVVGERQKGAKPSSD